MVLGFGLEYACSVKFIFVKTEICMNLLNLFHSLAGIGRFDVQFPDAVANTRRSGKFYMQSDAPKRDPHLVYL